MDRTLRLRAGRGAAAAAGEPSASAPAEALAAACTALAVAIGIRLHFGYFLARDPCVAYLYVLVGIKFLEAKGPRDGGLLVCLGLLTLTQFFYNQGMRAAAIALPVVLVLGGVLAALRAAPAATAGWKAPLAATARMLVQGVPLALLLFVVFPAGRSALGLAHGGRGAQRPVGYHGAGHDQRVVALRRRGLPRRFLRPASAAPAALLARTGAVALQRSRSGKEPMPSTCASALGGGR